MRNPFRSEAEAFGFVLVCVALFAAVALAGILAGGWVALGVFVSWQWSRVVRKGEPKPPDEPVRSREGGDRRRILVVANETVAGRALRGEVVRRAGAEADVFVVCPALNSPLRHWASDEDGARAEAEQRLAESLAALSSEGVDARGEVGDADPCRRWTTPCGRSAPTRSSSPPIPGPVELAREGGHRAGRASATRFRSPTWSSTSSWSAGARRPGARNPRLARRRRRVPVSPWSPLGSQPGTSLPATLAT